MANFRHTSMERPADPADPSGVAQTPSIRRYALVPAGRSDRNAGVRRFKLARVSGAPPGQLSAEREERLERVAGMSEPEPAAEEDKG